MRTGGVSFAVRVTPTCDACFVGGLATELSAPQTD